MTSQIGRANPIIKHKKEIIDIEVKERRGRIPSAGVSSRNAGQSFLDPARPETGGDHDRADRRSGQERGLDARVERGEVKRWTCK